MKQIFFTLLFLFFASFSFSQELKVKSFTHDEMNLEARIDGRTDLNGRQCALLKVLVRDDILECKGGNVGDIISKGVVKKIFVSPSARFLELEFKYSFPLKVTFADYVYATLSEGGTYTITLVDANSISQETSSVDVFDTYSVNGAKVNVYKTDDGIVFDNLGVTLREVNDKEKRDLNVNCGVKVVKVNNGKFKESGIKTNTVLLKVNDKRICGIEDFVKILQSVSNSSDPVLFIEAKGDSNRKSYFAVLIK